MKYVAYCTKDFKDANDIIDTLSGNWVYRCCDYGLIFADSIDELKDAIVDQIKERSEEECYPIEEYNYNIAKVNFEDNIGYVQLSYKVRCNVFDC